MSQGGAPAASLAGARGLAKAIAAQEAHNPRLLTTPGVVGTAVGRRADGTAVIRVFVERRAVGHIPLSLDGVPVAVQVTGALTAMRRPTNRPPVVTITSPADGAAFGAGATVTLTASAPDREDGDLSGQLVWTSSSDGVLGRGASFTRVLSTGVHAITASVTDAGGRTTTAGALVTVGSVALTSTSYWQRPVPTGVSTSNYQHIAAGTIACRVVDRSGRVYALSNAHVFAPHDLGGQGELGDIVNQPGLYDVPSHVYDPSLRLGVVAAYQALVGDLFTMNEMDAAIALTDETSLGGAVPVAIGGYGAPNSVAKEAAVGMAVQKYGRTTLLTKGTITGINAVTVVGYAEWDAWFRDQIVVETSGTFLQPGDSGSLVVTDDAGAYPVGLLFAGNAEGTMATVTPIVPILQYFGVTVDGK